MVLGGSGGLGKERKRRIFFVTHRFVHCVHSHTHTRTHTNTHSQSVVAQKRNVKGNI